VKKVLEIWKETEAVRWAPNRQDRSAKEVT